MRFDACRRDGLVRDLPQRGERHGQAGEPHPDDRRVRNLPCDDELGECPVSTMLVSPAAAPPATMARARPASRRSIPTTVGCESCHNTTNWTSVNFSHASVTGACATCHNGTSATGKPATRIPTTAGCDSCHATTNWTNVNFSHAGVTGACATCHNGTSATGKPATHIPTTATCDSCHNTTNWTSVNFSRRRCDRAVRAVTTERARQASLQRTFRRRRLATAVTTRRTGRA